MERTGTGFLAGGAGLTPGSASGKYKNNIPSVLNSIYASYTLTEALALPEKNLRGRIWIDGRPYYWSSTCDVDDASNLLAARPTVIASASDPGRFVAEGPDLILPLSFTYATANNADLFTVPTGVVMQILGLWWDITADMTGGSSSAIGISSNKSGFTADGCLLGGPTGNVAAALTAALSPTPGTRGFLAAPAGSRIVQETVAVATAAATPTFAVQQLLFAKTIATGAPAVKTPLINGATPSAGEAAPNAGGTSVVFHAETTGTGTADLAYLTQVGATIENTFWVGGDTIRYDRITSAFTAGSGILRVAVRIIELPLA